MLFQNKYMYNFTIKDKPKVMLCSVWLAIQWKYKLSMKIFNNFYKSQNHWNLPKCLLTMH